MNNLKIGDIVGLSWIKGNGNAEVVGVYQNYVMVIHPCFSTPRAIHKNDIVSPEKIDKDQQTKGDAYCFLKNQILRLESENRSLHDQITEMESERIKIDKLAESIQAT